MTFPVTHSVLSPHALQKVLDQEYDIPAIEKLDYFQAGLNDTYLVQTCAKNRKKVKYILRAYRKDWRNGSDINYEIDALNLLHKNNNSVSTPIRRRDKSYITSVDAPEGLRYLVLFNYIPGKPPQYKTEHEIEASIYGQAFGQLHQSLKNFSSPHLRFKLNLEHLLNKPLKSIEPFLSHRLTDWTYLTALANKLKHQYQQLPPDALQTGFCHGDLNTKNVHIQNGKIGLFDFDCCGQGYHSADIAVFLWGAKIDNKEDAIWQPFLSAYLKENPLKEIDLKTVPMFVTMRHIWHIGLHIQLSRDRGNHWVNDEYFDKQIQILKNWEAL